MDILYLGVNMGNCKERFFCRYPEAEEDYYETFRWLIKLKDKYKICIKHHPGDYRNNRDRTEYDLMKNTGIEYLDNQLNSYELSRQAKMCVSYCSTMILELNGFSNLARYIYSMRHKKYSFKKPCMGLPERKITPQKPAFYLDPHHSNRQFCRYIDDVNKHNCYECLGNSLEIYEPYRLTSYEEFAQKAEEIICSAHSTPKLS